MKRNNINRIWKDSARTHDPDPGSGTGYLNCVNPSCNYCFLKRDDHSVVGTSECVNRDGIVRSMRATEWWREQCSSRECIVEVHRLDPASAAPLLIPCPNLNPAETRFLGARTHTHSSPPSYPFVSSMCFFSKKKKGKNKGKIFVCGKFLFECGLGRGFWSNINYTVKSLEIESRLLQSLQDDLFQFSFFLFLSISTNKSLIFFLKIIVILKLINFIEFHYWVKLKYRKYL